MGIEVFKEWLDESAVYEKLAVASLADTSLNMLYQLGSENRKASSDLAGRIVSAISCINSRARHKPLPSVGRGDLAAACAKCPYYNSCEEFKE
jgi:hypothetical protein